MRKLIYYCDVCGKEFADEPQKSVCRILLKERHLFMAYDIQETEIDICTDCKKEFYKLLKLVKEAKE